MQGGAGKRIEFLINVVVMIRNRDSDRVRVSVRVIVSVRCNVFVVYLTELCGDRWILQ